jgi:hypothetical protein
MKIGIMQPYFLPYIGYFQLMNHVDKFVVYDNIKYTKKGWINRNRMLVNGTDQIFSLPIKKGSDYLNIDERFLADNFHKESQKTLKKIQASYSKAPYFDEVYPLINRIFEFQDDNLFRFILNSIHLVKSYIKIPTEILVSSNLEIDHMLASQEKVIEISRSLGATIYVNPIGGIDLYKKMDFKKSGVDLQFLKTEFDFYKQFDYEFISGLSILDVLMFNSPQQVMNSLGKYDLL